MVSLSEVTFFLLHDLASEVPKDFVYLNVVRVIISLQD